MSGPAGSTRPHNFPGQPPRSCCGEPAPAGVSQPPGLCLTSRGCCAGLAFQSQRPHGQHPTGPPMHAPHCHGDPVPMPGALPPAWWDPLGVLHVETCIWGVRGTAVEGSVPSLVYIFIVWSCLASLSFKPTRKTAVYFLLHGPELSCLLRKCQLTPVLQVPCGPGFRGRRRGRGSERG